MIFSPVGARLLNNYFRILRLSYADLSNQPDLKNHSLVRTVDKEIDGNTNVFIESPVHVKIIPTDFNDPKAHKKLVMQLYSQGKGTGDFTVKQSPKRLELVNVSTKTDHSDICLIRVPLNLKVHVTTTNNATVDISKMQGAEFVIKTDKGTVTLNDLQAKQIKVSSKAGGIVSQGKLQASLIDMKTGLNSGVLCSHVMANNFSVSTHGGLIDIKSCYSEQSHFVTAMGNINLNHMHRKCKIDVIQKGDLSISGFEGQLQATIKSGNVFLHAAKLVDKSQIFIHETGKIELQLTESIKNLIGCINLIANKISIDKVWSKMGKLMTDSHPQRFHYPSTDIIKDVDSVETMPKDEIIIECRNGTIDLKQTEVPFIINGVIGKTIT